MAIFDLVASGGSTGMRLAVTTGSTGAAGTVSIATGLRSVTYAVVSASDKSNASTIAMVSAISAGTVKAVARNKSNAAVSGAKVYCIAIGY
jgi:hypothetical protein